MARLGLDHRDPLDYTGIPINVVPVTSGPREPTVYDRRYPLFTEWRIGANPTTGTEGDWWKLVNFTSGDAIWVKTATGSSGGILSLSDTANTYVYPAADGNVQLEAGAGMTITSDAANNKLVFALGGGGTAVDQIDVDFNTAPGTDPVLPSATGQIGVLGNVVTNATNANAPVATHSRAANQFHVDVQLATAVAPTPADLYDVGLISMNNAQFVVDGNGFCSMKGGANLPSIQTLTGDSGGAIGPDANGNIDIVGSGDIAVAGSANTLTISSPNEVTAASTLTDYAVVCGSGGARGVQTIAGLGTSGQVLTSNGAGALPTFQDSGSGTVAYNTVSLTLTAAQMNALAGTPQELIPAPSAGEILIPLWCYWFLDYSGAAFTAAGGEVGLYYNSTNKITNFSIQAWDGMAADYYGWCIFDQASIGASGGYVATGVAGQNITLMNTGPNLANGGTSTVTFLCCYTTITLP